MRVFVKGVELRLGEMALLDGGITIVREPQDSDADYAAACLRSETLLTPGSTVSLDGLFTGDVPSRMLADRVRPSTHAFLRRLHPGKGGFLELRAFRKGERPAPSCFVPLPITRERLQM